MARRTGVTLRMEITGAKEVRRVFNKLPAAIQKKVVRPAIAKAAAPVRKHMRAHIPIEDSVTRTLKSGGTKTTAARGDQRSDTKQRMKKSIVTVIRTERRYSRRGIVLAVVGPRKGDLARRIGKNQERLDKIAIGLERGWRGRPKKPFMTKAYTTHKRKSVRIFKGVMRNTLPKVIAKEAARARLKAGK